MLLMLGSNNSAHLSLNKIWVMHFYKKLCETYDDRILTKRSLNHIWNFSIWPPLDWTVNVIPGQILRSNHVTLKEITHLLEIGCKTYDIIIFTCFLEFLFFSFHAWTWKAWWYRWKSLTIVCVAQASSCGFSCAFCASIGSLLEDSPGSTLCAPTTCLRACSPTPRTPFTVSTS